MDKTLPKLLKRISGEYPEIPGMYFKNSTGEFETILFKEYYQTVLDFASGLLAIGEGRKSHIGLIADNRPEWLYCSMGILAIGAADVPRGSDATEQDLAYILSLSDCTSTVLENERQALKVIATKKSLTKLKNVILMDEVSTDVEKQLAKLGLQYFTYEKVLILGKERREKNPDEIENELNKGDGEDIATIIFTSGTTGEPKGVMLTHRNFLCQLEELPERIILNPGEKALSVLPVWHSFERMCEYVILYSAGAIVYSKPVGSIMLADFEKTNPQLFPSVPRIWESVYEGIYRQMRKTGGITWALFSFFVNTAILCSRFERKVLGRSPRFKKGQRFFDILVFFIPWILLLPLKALGGLLVFRKIRVKLGNSFRDGVSGGGALPPHVDEFFWAVGINVLEGYGLTETAPVVAVRPGYKPIFGTIGSTISCCEVKIVDDSGNILPPGKKGTVMIRGENVMKGYYNRPDLTKEVLSDDGWLDSGDLGQKTIDGEIILTGRKKDTIVLRGGENIEPVPIEMKLNESRYIETAVVLGQDQRYLATLIVVNKEEVLAYAMENNVDHHSFEQLLEQKDIKKLFENEIASLISQKNGFKLFERINRFALLEKPFEVGVELSAKQEVMRYKLGDIYKKEVKELFK